MCLQMVKTKPLSIENVRELCKFVQSVFIEYKEFKKDESSMILFGRKTEMDDIRNASM